MPLTVPPGTHFTPKHLLLVIAEAYLHDLSSMRIIKRFENTDVRRTDVSQVDVARLLTGEGADYASLVATSGHVPDAIRELDCLSL
ncbi:hypothetical protein MMPV_000926 [Pyropia vietnamensis]